ncbi:hydrolase [Vibrio sp. vnigr-6D03]|uniref:MBL fold metallo-hydrolase n=1 Tax=Vibrio sp. vnigr-6D03 TaxID=2058088 RepID=UPI000C33967F|nr:MBL fold metallo-hydrolase [Vibrio sp. vnigr-6D03]PKF81213.1 hydrolase [Vibrio sp. vnigr-6D03]
MKRRILLVIGVIVMATAGITIMSSSNEDGKFVNTDTRYETDSSNIWQITKAYVKANRITPTPSTEIPVLPVTPEQLSASHDAMYRLGHSTILMRLNGKLILTDPVLSERASPVQWAGPKRFHESPISGEDLPEIEVVVISHDHYDHLDKDAIKLLDSKVKRFLAPLKVGQRMIEWGVSPDKVIEMDWWDEYTVEGIKFVATPSQHFSGRGLFDRDKTLWASWVIQSETHNLFFSGDSGYFNGFKQIGEKYGPFDVTMVETGAYNELWSDIHMMPEGSMQAHLDLKGHYMMPIHNGTFDLSLHDWYEPFERVLDLATQNNVTLLTPKFGQEIALDNVPTTPHWWREVEAEKHWDEGEVAKNTLSFN